MKEDGLKVRTLLLGGFGALLVLMLAVAGAGYWGLAVQHDRANDVALDRVPKILVSEDWAISVLQSARHMRNALIIDGQDAVKDELAQLVQNKADRKQYMERLAAVVNTPDGQAALKEIVDARAAYVPSEDEFIKLALAGDVAAAKKVLVDRARPAQLKYLDAITRFIDVQRKLVEETNARSSAVFATQRIVALVVVVAALGIGLGIALWLTRRIQASLGGEPGVAAAVARAVAHGDLTVPITLRADDRQSLMAQLKQMQDSLSRVVADVRRNAESVAAASGQIAAGNSDLSQRTEEQASAVEQTTAAMAELGASVKQNADNAQHANRLALGASEVAVRGGSVVGQVVDTMREINDSSRKIAEIISVIDGIAFQTNILALNAAVEAARAGDQGRGFAVVASEVRNLAQRSAGAAREIKSLIGASVERVEQGTKLVDDAGTTMQEIVAAIKRVTDIMGEISHASHEQSSGVTQVSTAMGQMDQTTQQNAALVEQSAAAAASMKDQAQHLLQSVGVFQLVPGGAG